MVIEYKGYVVSQSDYNNHVMIIKDGHMVMHAQCTKKMTERELQKEVDMFLEIVKEADGIYFDYEAEDG